MMPHNNRKREVRVAVLTPYLAGDILKMGFSEEFVKDQTERFGYDPDNLQDVKMITTPDRKVILDSPPMRGPAVSGVEIAKTIMLPSPADLVIVGGNPHMEALVSSMRGSGIVVARYSIFYHGPSRLTGAEPEDAGYAIDIPKSPKIARALISDDRFLDALVARDAPAVRSALESLTERINERIKATPYLEAVLGNGRH